MAHPISSIQQLIKIYQEDGLLGLFAHDFSNIPDHEFRFHFKEANVALDALEEYMEEISNKGE